MVLNDMRTLTHQAVLNILPDRNPIAHKGDFGKILLLCGSKGYTGAAALAAMGALRTGAGLVYLGVPESIYAIEAIKLDEPVVFPLADEGGMLSDRSIGDIKGRLGTMDAVLVGPGIGRSPGTRAVVTAVLESYQGPVVLDADGINVLSGHRDVLRGRKYPTILTPHDKEFRRIGGDLSIDRIQAAESFAREMGVVLLLKGHETIITNGQQTYVNGTGNPGMAVGGCGDVLSGMIVSLLGQGIEPLEAAAAAAWLHGKAGDVCAQELGQYGMLPTDMLRALPRLLK